jgi:glycerate-2-kinase
MQGKAVAKRFIDAAVKVQRPEKGVRKEVPALRRSRMMVVMFVAALKSSLV